MEESQKEQKTLSFGFWKDKAWETSNVPEYLNLLQAEVANTSLKQTKVSMNIGPDAILPQKEKIEGNMHNQKKR